jgi:hypothetical protein
MAHIKLGAKLFEDTSATIAAKTFMNVQVFFIMTFLDMSIRVVY